MKISEYINDPVNQIVLRDDFDIEHMRAIAYLLQLEMTDDIADNFKAIIETKRNQEIQNDFWREGK